MSVFHASVLLHEFRHNLYNIVKVAMVRRLHLYFDNVMMKFIVNKRTDT